MGRVRPDLLVHALAQLPDGVSLELPAERRSAPLELLAEAYGVRSRLRLVSSRAAPALVDGEHGSMAELVAALAGGDDSEASACRGSDELLTGQRILVVTNLPTHYRVPLFNTLDRRLSRAGAAFRVLFTSATPRSRAWMTPEPLRFDHAFLRSRHLPVGSADVPLDLERSIRRFRPSIVLVGGFSPQVAGRVALHARLAGAVCGVWTGAIARAGSPRGFLRRCQRALLLRATDFAVAYGHLSAEYVRELAPSAPIVYGRNTSVAVGTGPPGPRDGVLEVLAVGQAIPRKGLDVAVAAFERLRDTPCRLTVIGDGTGLGPLKAQASGLSNVRFLGAVPSDRTVAAYRDADMFVFPTRSDVFGLVLVEAMGAGLPTVVSSAPGAVADLALPGRNCLVVDGHDPDAWAASISRLVEQPELRASIGREARDTIVRRWTMDHAADAMIAGLRLGVLARSAP